MIFTKRSDYGLRAAMELAAGYGSGPMSARQIARRGNLPEPFVRKLLQELAQAGLANSERGRNGGYMLARSPAEVTVRATLEAFETLAPVPCLDTANGTRLTRAATEPGAQPAPSAEAALDDEACTLAISEFSCPTRAAWHLVDRKVRATLEAMTLDDLLHEVRHRGLSKEMIHAS
jgi:Rrf2 family protein